MWKFCMRWPQKRGNFHSLWIMVCSCLFKPKDVPAPSLQFSSVAQSCPTLQPHESQHQPVQSVHQPQASSIMHRTWTGNSFHIWYYSHQSCTTLLKTLLLSLCWPEIFSPSAYVIIQREDTMWKILGIYWLLKRTCIQHIFQPLTAFIKGASPGTAVL